MSIELTVPQVGESVTEVEVGQWLKAEGDSVKKDEVVVTLESEKATVELPAPADGVMGTILKQKGQPARVGEVIGHLNNSAAGSAARKTDRGSDKESARSSDNSTRSAEPPPEPKVMPAAQAALAEHGLRAEDVPATGPGGRLLKEDVQREAKAKPATKAPPAPPAKARSTSAPRVAGGLPDQEEEIVPMSPLRRTLAQRLVSAQQTAALLTTFNELDMSAVMGLRKEFGEAFLAKYQIKLGFMSFFVKAVVEALKETPALNAEVRGTDIIYRNHYDIGVAIGGGKGLVVPVLRRVERLSFAQIEQAIADFARRAKENKLKLDELQGGTFTISNGGIYGSLLSTPIVNPPQSGILGMHTIQDRPVARDGAVVIRPMMYLALTYDHRIVDGREAVTFLRRIKETLETPARLLMEI